MSLAVSRSRRHGTWRARLLRLVLLGVARALRRRRGGLPDPDDAVALERYGVVLREQFDRFGAQLRLPRHVSCEPVEEAGVAGLWVTDRSTAGGGHVVMYVHGGGYVAGSPYTYRRLGARFARTTRAAVFLPRYRLAPEHPFPAALDDVSRALDWLIETRGVPPSAIVVGGDSAGAGLALAALVRRRDTGAALPAAYVGFAPWVDLGGTGDSTVSPRVEDPWLPPKLVVPAGRAYAGGRPLDDPLVSPLYADLAELPPMLVHVGADDALFDDARRLVDRARAAGVDAALGTFPDLWHGFQVLPLPETRRSLREVGGFVRRHLGA